MQPFELRGVEFSFGEKKVLADITLNIGAGKLVGLIGANGSGKTTLLHLLAGLKKPKKGQVLYHGHPLESLPVKVRAQKIAYLPQENEMHFGFSVRQTVLLGRFPHQGRFAVESPNDGHCVQNVLQLCDLDGFEARSMGELSGGERQRVFLAKVLAQNTQVLLLDEPTNFLDVKHQVGVCQRLRALAHEKNLMIVAVFHDLNLAATYCDEMVVLKNGQILASGEPNVVFNAALLRQAFDADVFVAAMPNTKRPYYLPVEVSDAG